MCTTTPGKRAGTSRPDRGIARLRHETLIQRDAVVASCRRSAPMLDET